MKNTGTLLNAAKMLIIVILIIPLTGCWDLVEMEEQAYVTAIGIDKGKDNMLEVTIQIINPQGGGFSSVLGSSTKEPAAETITLTAPDILTVRDTANASVTRRISYSHARTLIVSEELARSGELLPALEGALRDRQIRRNISLIVSKEKASEFIRSNDPKMESRPHKFYEFMAERWKEAAFVPVSNLHKFLQFTEGKSEVFLNIYGTTEKTEEKVMGEDDEYLPGQIDQVGGNPAQLIGSAVFKGGKMIGTLTGEETRYAAILRLDEKMGSIFINIPDPLKSDYFISARIYKSQNIKFNIDIEKEAPEVSIEIPMSVFLIGIPSGVDYVGNLDNQEHLKRYIAEGMAKRAEELIEKTQKQFGGEAFSWSREVRSKFNTWDEYMDYNWMEKYPKANVDIKFDIVIEGFGKQVEPPEIIK